MLAFYELKLLASKDEENDDTETTNYPSRFLAVTQPAKKVVVIRVRKV